MKRLQHIHQSVFPAPELLLGMGLAQIIATLQVYFSNLRLFAKMTAVARAGFLPVPNQEAMSRLLGLDTAFWGGLLFTLSVGAGISLLSITAAWIWHRRFPPGGLSVLALASLPAAALVFMNSRGMDIWISLYFIVIPAPVFWTARRFLNRTGSPPDRQILAWRILPLIVLALAWFTQYDRSLFVDLRDHLLMSNAAGNAVSSFYYRYTLYPAEVFKSFDQRLIKTVARLDAGAGARHAELTRELIRRDYLPVDVRSDVDIRVRLQADRLVFTHASRPVLETTIGRFLTDPRPVMTQISNRTDRWSPFRAITFYGVLLGFPVALYFLLLAFLRLFAGIIAGGARADALAAAVCLLIGLGILAYFHVGREAAFREGDIGAALNSTRWQERVAALKEIRERRLDICRFPVYVQMLGSLHHPERYWLARALAASPSAAASGALTRLLDDPQINVRTMAFEGLAERKDKGAVKEILQRLKCSEDWYGQMYAYKALKALGWDQGLPH